MTESRGGWFARLRSGLGRSASRLSDGVGSIFSRRKIDAESLQELEELLISADLGPATAASLTAALKQHRFDGDGDVDEVAVRIALAEKISDILAPYAVPLEPDPAHRPAVILIAGVNGSGKTTTIGKLTKYFSAQGKKVVIAAGDTFRAAAIDQLRIWADRTNTTLIAKEPGTDPASLAYDALEQARATHADILIIDTAGRLHNKADLMAELQKIIRVLRKLDPTAPHHALLVLDATTGQNAHAQLDTFRSLIDINGLIVTKLDGSARGGVVVALAQKHHLPIHAVGVGEGIDDLRPFSARNFAAALMGLANGDADES